MLSVSVDVSAAGGSSMPLIRHYRYLHADWWECVCVFRCVDGVVCAVFPHLSAGCPSLMAVEAPLVPTVLIDVAQYCVGRQGLLFCNSDMLITTPFSPQKREIAGVVRLRLELMVSSANVSNYLLFRNFFANVLCLRVRIMFLKTGQFR